MKEQIIYVNRKNTNCYKWDSLKKEYGDKKLLPMSIADMDFKTPECVRTALMEYIDMGALGYNIPSEEYFDAFCEWERKYHNNEIKREWIRYAPGVVVAISWILEQITNTGDAAIILTPVYAPFFDMVVQNELTLVCSSLINDNGKYSIDYADFEKKIIQNNVKVFIFCSPHNPIGRVWKKDELEKLIHICKKNSVIIISDEIHHDVVLFGNKHIPLLTVGDYEENIIMLTSVAKSFNLAGVENSFMIIPNKEIREKIDKYQDRIATHAGNSLGYVAVTAAYRNGREWLEEVCKMIESNYVYVKESLLKELPLLEIGMLEGTFLMWIGFGAYLREEENLHTVMIENCGLVLNQGRMFGGEEYKTYARINIATSRENVEFAVKKIVATFRCKTYR